MLFVRTLSISPFLFIFWLALFNTSALANPPNENEAILELYEKKYGDIPKKDICNLIWTRLDKKMPSVSVNMFKACFEKAEKKEMELEAENALKTKLRSTDAEMARLTRVYGEQVLFSKMLFFGVLLVESAMEMNDITEQKKIYTLNLFMLSFHRHMMAQYMQVNCGSASGQKFKKFGNVEISGGLLSTQLYEQFPEACKLIRKRIEEDHTQFSDACPKFDYANINYPDFKEGELHCKKPLFKHENKSWPLSRLYIPISKESWSPETECFLIAFGLSDIQRLESVLVMHGWGAMEDVSKNYEIEDIAKQLFVSLFTVVDENKLIENIAKIAYIESHLTFIFRGGGSLVEMLIEGLLRFNNLPSYLYPENQVPKIPLWSKAFCYPDSDEFVKEMKKDLLPKSCKESQNSCCNIL